MIWTSGTNHFFSYSFLYFHICSLLFYCLVVNQLILLGNNTQSTGVPNYFTSSIPSISFSGLWGLFQARQLWLVSPSICSTDFSPDKIHVFVHNFFFFYFLLWSTAIAKYYHYYSFILRVFHTNVSWWFHTGLWVTASLLKSPESVYLIQRVPLITKKVVFLFSVFLLKLFGQMYRDAPWCIFLFFLTWTHPSLDFFSRYNSFSFFFLFSSLRRCSKVIWSRR